MRELGAALRTAAFVALGVGGLAGLIPALVADLVPGPLFFLGLPLILAGLAVYVWTVWVFVSQGHGTPIPLDPPRVLVVHGLYRKVRNPMALGLCLTLVGEAIAFGALSILVYAAILFSVIHLFVVFIEEPGLRSRFGAPYEAYRRSVRRWVPRVSGFRRSPPTH